MQFYSKRNLNFLLHEVFNIEDLSEYKFFEDHNRETYDMVLDACADIAKNKLQPILVEMDRVAPDFVDGRIKVHPDMRGLMKEFGEGGQGQDDGQERLGPARCYHADLATVNQAGQS